MAENKYKVGDIVYHAATRDKFVVVAVSSTIFVKCRYKNTTTGLYEVQEFRVEELYNPDMEK